MHNRKAVTKVLYHAFVVLFGFMMVYPVLWMISGSFKGNAEILRGTLSLIPKELKLTNYATGWKGFGGTTFATFFLPDFRTFGGSLGRSTVAHFARKVRGANIAAAKHELKIQQSHAQKRWSCSLRARGPHFASKVSYNAGAATDDCAGQCKSPLRGRYR